MNIPRENLISPAPVGAADVNPSALAAPGAATRAAGRTITEGSEQFQNLMVKLGRAKDESGFSEMRQIQRRVESDMAQFVADNPDQEAWQPELEKRLMQAEEQADKIEFTNAGRTRAMQKHAEWREAKAGELAIQATQMQIRRGKTRLMDEVEEGVRLSDPERVAEATAGLRDFEMPEKVEQLERDALRSIEENNFRALIEESPLEADERIKKGDLPDWMGEAKKRDLERLTERAKEDARSEEIEMLKLAEETGTLGGADIEAAEFLTEQDKKLWAGRLENLQQWDARGQSETWRRMFNLREAMKDPALTHEQYAALRNETEMSMISEVPKEYRGEFNSFMSRHSVANRVSYFELGQRERRDERKDEALRRVQSALDSGTFGSVGDESAHKKAAAARIKVIDFFEDNPEATLTDAVEYVDQLISGDYTDARGVPALRDTFGTGGAINGGPGVLPPLDDDAAAELDALFSDGE